MPSLSNVEFVAEMKFCRDCKHHMPRPADPTLAQCNKAPRDPDPDYMVTGIGEIRTRMYCSTVRASNSQCGPEAKWFEPKFSVVGE